MFCGKINSSKFKLQDLCHQIGEIEWTVKINQRVPNANLWIINYCILEVKADNEPAVSLLVYFKSVKKWKCFTKKKTNKQKEKKTAFFPLPHKCHFRTRPIPLSKIGGNAICARFLQLYRQNQYGDL